MYPLAHTPSRGLYISDNQDKYPLSHARSIAFEIRNQFPLENGLKVVIAGSILRRKDFVHDIDIVINSTKKEIQEKAASILGVQPMPFKISGKYKEIPTQIWFCNENEWGPMLLEVTGPRNFNQFLRSCAKRNGLYLSSKGLFIRNSDDTPGKRIDNNTEGHIIYTILGKAWIPPELRY